MTTDPTITIAGLRAKVSVLIDHLETANQSRVNFSCGLSKMEAHAAEVEAERDALAAQLAEVRAKLDAAPKVCAIHSYEHGPGPCMTCGAWPPGTRELIAACQTRIAGLEQAADERSAEVARLTARMAELEARPVLTAQSLCDALVHARAAGDFLHVPAAVAADVANRIVTGGPVTLPSPDRAEELAATLVGTARASMTDVPIAWSCDFADGNENARRALTNVVRTALANLSPAPAPTFDAAFLRRVMVATKHGPNGKGGPGPCDAACVKCEAELMAKAAPAREAAPTLVAVSDEELMHEFYTGAENGTRPVNGIRAVRAKLGAAEVTEERVKAALKLVDGIEAKSWEAMSAEIARLTAERDAARAVTVDVCRYLDCAASDLLAVVTSIYESRARAISDATAARGTVGGLLAAGEERESRAWSEKGKAPPGSCPFCASRISMVQRDGYFIARCSHRGCGAVGPRMRSVSRAADLFCQPPRREAQGMSCGPIVASPPRPRCSCTHEAGDSRCDAHPTCSECGASTTRPVDGCEACRGPLPKGG